MTLVKNAIGTNYVAGAELTMKDANAYNATLDGARLTTDVKETFYYTQAECDEYNAGLDGAVSTDDTNPNTSTNYTQEEANAYNANLAGARKTTDVKTIVYYSQAECDDYNKSIENYIAKHTKLDAGQANLVNNALTPSYNTNDAISTEHANAYNATLPGALKTTDVKTEAVWAWYSGNTELTTPPTLNPRNTAYINNDVFGGGKGKAEETGSDAFTCAKGMIGVDGDGIDYPDGGTNITIGNGTVTIGGSVYGGGEIGRVEKNTSVTIGLGDGTGNYAYPAISGNVFGAGKGVETHGYSALVRGNSTVTIQGDAKVQGCVYGGGEIASIGRYNVVGGRPTSLKNPNSGNCNVTVQGYAEIGPNDMIMTKEGGPDNKGHVFGAGKGATPGVYTSAQQMTVGKTMAGFSSEDDYLKFIETLALATQTNVTISGNAFVKGDVFGGAEQGFVQHDTHVTIDGNCQIGNGYVQMDDDGNYLDELVPSVTMMAVNRRYTAEEWTQGKLIPNSSTEAALYEKVNGKYYQHSLPECASWKYMSPYESHDIYAASYDSKGGAVTATSGRTFFGNVFGGGSGYFPYAAGKWHWKSGNVGGNSEVLITGGHVLTNVYGGNEMTNVEGTATVTMTGGTIGVPRTLGQIMKHPVTCYLFGGGGGDPRVLFNKQTNVQDAVVSVTGGWVYGSVFGGGEDGHVMRNVNLTIGGTAKIGTWGTSYVDGNIFGGGRGYNGDAYTAGNVAGCVNMTISGGEILGSVYGGGRLGSVGYGLYDATTPSGDPTPGYGEIRDDDKYDDGTDGSTFFTKGRGHVEINITGGTIGNTNEFIIPTAANPGAGITGNIPVGLPADFKTWSDANWTAWKNHNNVPNTEYIHSNGRVNHTKGGNVYAGGMGRREQMDGVTEITAVDWRKLGNVKSTKLTISGANTWIMGNVYGGGEVGAVQGNHKQLDDSGNPIKDTDDHDMFTGTEIVIKDGATIGTEVTASSAVKATVAETGVVKYTYGSVYGGGMGTMKHYLSTTEHAGEVKDSTKVTISGAATRVRASVFGGGEIAEVGGNTNVTINNGIIGRNEVWGFDEAYAKDDENNDVYNPGYVKFGSSTMGNVFGGGKGVLDHTNAGLVKGNTSVTVNDGYIYHNVYGGGALASVGTFGTSTGTDDQAHIPAGIPYGWTAETGTARVTINGGTIGISGRDNGMVNGSSRGDVEKPTGNPAVDRYDKLGWVKDSYVTIGKPAEGTAGEEGYVPASGPEIKGSVYGGGENGHNAGNTTVTVNAGTIGIASNSGLPWASFIPADMKEKDDGYDYYKGINDKAEITRGNVYGAGCGTDTYTDTSDGNKEKHNPWAGIVCGNTTVNIKGGYITQNVYGAGSMASVGTVTSSTIHRNITGEETDHEVVHGFALSWPYEFVYAPNTGKATVNITGGHLGVVVNDTTYTGGDVYGSARGEADNRYIMALQAKVRETEVNVNYAETANIESIDLTDPTTQCITGSVHGSGENGFVYEDTHVTLNKGLIVHSVYGGGKGKGTYKKSLKILAGANKGQNHDQEVYGLLSGKVLGNTFVTMNGGHVMRNIFGGGNIASVGKGNYASGTDDYAHDSEIGAAQGYGEIIDGNLWTSAFNPDIAESNENPKDNAWYFLNSGKTSVRVLGGKVGYVNKTDPSLSIKNDLPYGNVFGGSAGEAAPEVSELPRYLYCPAFFSGYVNETDVVIGRAATPASGTEGEEGYVPATAASGPVILGSVYGGGQDGHVRRDTHVTVYAGEIGLPFTDETDEKWRTVFGKTANTKPSDELDNPQWMFRGNVFGGGSGISLYKFDFDGNGKTNGTNIEYGTDPVTGESLSVNEKDNSTSSGSVTRFTTVDIKGGTIHHNVYGGGSLGSVGAPDMGQTYLPYKPGQDNIAGKPENGLGRQSMCTVTIGGAGKVTIGSPTDYAEHYGGEVYGACRGDSKLDANKFASSIWTKVLIKDGANILGNVFGGGDAGKVKRDTDVQIGAE